MEQELHCATDRAVGLICAPWIRMSEDVQGEDDLGSSDET